MARLPVLWEDLILKSKNIDANLKMVKQKFTEVRNWDTLKHTPEVDDETYKMYCFCV